MNWSKNAPPAPGMPPSVAMPLAGRPRVRGGEEQPDLGGEGGRREGLGEVARRAGAERGLATLVVTARGEDDHGQAGEALVRAHEAQHLEPVDVGHVEVEQ